MSSSPYSPYAPPQHENQAPYGSGYVPYAYKPLGWRTTATVVGIVATVVLASLQTAATLAFPDALKHPAPENLGIILTLGLLGLVAGGVSIFTWILFLVWTNLAAKNVRAFGQIGLEYTPGWCVGWWFIPVASLYKPFDALREVWKASDPETVGPAAAKPWAASVVPGIFIAWWAVYLTNGFVAIIIALVNLDLSGPKPVVIAGPSSFITHALLGVAGVFLIILMRKLAQRQEAAWARLSSAAGTGTSAGMGTYGRADSYGTQASSANPYV